MPDSRLPPLGLHQSPALRPFLPETACFEKIQAELHNKDCYNGNCFIVNSPSIARPSIFPYAHAGMKHLWKFIERELQDRQWTARQLSDHLKLDPAQLSRLRNGATQDLSADFLSRLLQLAEGSPAKKTELLAAYLRDKLQSRVTADIASESSHRVRDDVSPYMPGATTLPGLASLPPRVRTALAELVTAAQDNRRLQKLLIGLAEYACADNPE